MWKPADKNEEKVNFAYFMYTWKFLNFAGYSKEINMVNVYWWHLLLTQQCRNKRANQKNKTSKPYFVVRSIRDEPTVKD